MNHPFSRLGLAVGLCGALLLTGCGNDNNDTPTTPSTPAPVQPTPEPSAAPTPAPAPSTNPNPGVGDAVVFLGKVKNVTPPSIRIGGQDVLTDENTQFDRGGNAILLTDLQVGEIVRVHGTIMSDGTSILATRIAVEQSTDKGNQ